MMVRGSILVVLAWSGLAAASERGQAIFQQHCARCHVVGRGAPVVAKNFVDITLAARQHDEPWLRAFLQAPYKVDVNSACRANLDARAASEVYRFLRTRVRPAPGQAAPATALPHGRRATASAMPEDEPSAPVGRTPPDAVMPAGGTSLPSASGVPPQTVSRVAPPPAPKATGRVRR